MAKKKASTANAYGDLLKQVEEAGGKVISPAFLITPESGYCGFFTDIEGNRTTVHSRTN